MTEICAYKIYYIVPRTVTASSPLKTSLWWRDWEAITSCFFACSICYIQHIILDIAVPRFWYPRNIQNLLSLTEIAIWSRKMRKHQFSNFQDCIDLPMFVNKAILSYQIKTQEPFVVTFMINTIGNYKLDSFAGE